MIRNLSGNQVATNHYCAIKLTWITIYDCFLNRLIPYGANESWSYSCTHDLRSSFYYVSLRSRELYWVCNVCTRGCRWMFWRVENLLILKVRIRATTNDCWCWTFALLCWQMKGGSTQLLQKLGGIALHVCLNSRFIHLRRYKSIRLLITWVEVHFIIWIHRSTKFIFLSFLISWNESVTRSCCTIYFPQLAISYLLNSSSVRHTIWKQID